ncbi:hypothetical protein LNQ03_17970 [Klebsiella pneumoniae subsp. pneumoniae]|nr:hypothetical protein [Klebsiella pneumoniae subsp. pneumoniae]
MLIFISGMCINGAQNGLRGLFARLLSKPRSALPASAGCMVSGRTGAILSSTLGGMLMLAVPGHSSIFLVLALPACLAGICIFVAPYESPLSLDSQRQNLTLCHPPSNTDKWSYLMANILGGIAVSHTPDYRLRGRSS